jgi:hypothetical protein
MEVRDVRMVEGSERLCLALEAREALGIRRKCFWQDFDRNVATKPRIARAIDLL